MSKSKPNKDQLSFSTFDKLEEFKDISLLSIGEAKGHGMMVDAKSLETAFKVAVGKSIPAYDNHQYTPKVTDRIGFFSGIFIDHEAGKLKAAQYKFLDSYKEKNPDDYNLFVEQVENHPETFGVSLTHKFTLVWVFENGEEISAMNDYWQGNPAPEGAEELPRVRFTKIISADFVSSPAANPDGLFSEKEEETEQFEEEEETNVPNIPLKYNDELIMIKELKDKYSEQPELLVEAISFASGEGVESFSQVESHIEQFKTKLDIEDKDKEIESLKTQLSEKETEFQKQLSEKEDKLKDLTSQLETLKGGQENFSTGEEAGEVSDIQKEYEAIEGFSERMAFYQKHKEELSK